MLKTKLRRPGSRLLRREAINGYLMILPWVLGLLIFNLGPILATFYFSFTEYNALKPPIFIGLNNYIKTFTGDQLFWQSLYNTSYYVIISVPLEMLLALTFAVLLNRGVRGRRIFQAIIYFPYIMPSVAVSVVWLWLLSTQYGIVNYGLGFIGIDPIHWLTNPEWSKLSLVLVNLWWRVGPTMIIYLAALQVIPIELYEAAEVDGGTGWQKLWNVTLPLMTPSIFFTLVLGLINSFQVFNSAFVMTGGGPLNSTNFLMLYIYDNAFRYFDLGYASAMAWVLFIVILGFTLLLFRGSRRWVYYEGEVR